ncbi:hypothetical protein [Ruminiclostridium hungatei]|uniref:hypothetical protein n=1 Tax=Ruminiclostridium hungatei TaxID=48256 RepID=UPI0009AC74FC|nr:hypothetical protein [Ruminiclostridium hungatei]
MKYPDGATEEKYEYDKNNRLKKLTNQKKDGTVLEEYKYTYDGAGNQTTKTETIQGKEKGTTAYRYDSLNSDHQGKQEHKRGNLQLHVQRLWGCNSTVRNRRHISGQLLL